MKRLINNIVAYAMLAGVVMAIVGFAGLLVWVDKLRFCM
jgi:hypothetical protein